MWNSLLKQFSSNPRETSCLRWLLLLFCCLSTVGLYYCFDNPGATHDHLKEQFTPLLGKSFEYYFNWLYSLYSFPNIVLPLFFGILILCIGLKSMYILLSVWTIIGQLLFMVGTFKSSIATMLFGRIIFGLGESMNICQTTLIVKWFYKKDVALPLGLSLTLSRLATVWNDVISPAISKDNTPANAYVIGLIWCVFSFLCTIMVCFIDYGKDNALSESGNEIPSAQGDVAQGNDSDNNISIWKELKHFSSLFWIISVICLLLYGMILPFNYIASGFLTNTFFTDMTRSEARKTAGIYMGIPFFISAILVPIVGSLVDAFGQRCYLTLGSSVTCTISFCLFFFKIPILSFILLGASYSVFAAVVWPAIAIIVPQQNVVGLAYGITTSIQNTGMAVNPIILAALVSETNNYDSSLVFFICLGVFAIVLSCVWIIINYHKNNILNITEFNEVDTKESKCKGKSELEEENMSLWSKGTDSKSEIKTLIYENNSQS